jgi:hypothetical protein
MTQIYNIEVSDLALEFIVQMMEEDPEMVNSPDKVRRCIQNFESGARMTSTELLVAIGLEKSD